MPCVKEKFMMAMRRKVRNKVDNPLYIVYIDDTHNLSPMKSSSNETKVIKLASLSMKHSSVIIFFHRIYM